MNESIIIHTSASISFTCTRNWPCACHLYLPWHWPSWPIKFHHPQIHPDRQLPNNKQRSAHRPLFGYSFALMRERTSTSHRYGNSTRVYCRTFRTFMLYLCKHTRHKPAHAHAHPHSLQLSLSHLTSHTHTHTHTATTATDALSALGVSLGSHSHSESHTAHGTMTVIGTWDLGLGPGPWARTHNTRRCSSCVVVRRCLCLSVFLFACHVMSN